MDIKINCHYCKKELHPEEGIELRNLDAEETLQFCSMSDMARWINKQGLI